MASRWDGYVKRVETFTTRVIQEELGGESYAADAGALAGVLDRVANIEDALRKIEAHPWNDACDANMLQKIARDALSD